MADDIKKIYGKLRLKFRGDFEDSLQRENPLLELKEVCLVLDENNKAIGFKIGDGIHNWNDLGYHSLDGNSGGGFIEVDQTYKPESSNAQSGKAVSQAIRELNEDFLDVLGMNYVNQEQFNSVIGDISTALDELHTYAQALVGGVTE